MPSSSGETHVRKTGWWTHGSTEYKIIQHLDKLYLRLVQRVANHRVLQRTNRARQVSVMTTPEQASLMKAPESGEEDSPAGQSQKGAQTQGTSAGRRAWD